MYDSINIHHNTLSNCLSTGATYLNNFFFSLEIIEESENTNLLTIEKIKRLVIDTRDIYEVKHPSARKILAQFKGYASKNLEFTSLNNLADYLKGDRAIIIKYLKDDMQGY